MNGEHPERMNGKHPERMNGKHPERNEVKSKEAALDGTRLWLALLFITLLAPACLSLTAHGAQRVDLFHAVVFNSCAFRAYQLHWQDHRRYPDEIQYDFIGSPVSFTLVEIWVEDGPTLRFSQVIPLTCPVYDATRLPSGGQTMK